MSAEAAPAMVDGAALIHPTLLSTSTCSGSQQRVRKDYLWVALQGDMSA
jgi:hypothetical protein